MIKFYSYTQLYPATAKELAAGIRMTGSDPARYSAALEKLRAHAIAADQAGVEGICYSEQHANIEGYTEISTNPLLLDTFIACNTQRLKVGQLGIVVTAHHPVRLAEDIATIDQISRGRVFCGFARGNSPRWVNVFSQHFGTEATHSDKSVADERNLRAVQEAWKIMKMAWTQDTFKHKGEFWTIPANDTQWNFGPTATHGQGMAADGRLEEIGVVPRLYQKTLPRVFAPLAFRLTTSKFWVGEGGTAVCFASNDEFMQTAKRVLDEVAAASGIERFAPVLAPGIFLMIGKTQEDAAAIRRDYEWLFKEAYTVPPFNVPMGRVIAGTADDVSRQIEDLLKVIPFDEMFVWHNIGLHDERLEKDGMELFLNKVMPRFA